MAIDCLIAARDVCHHIHHVAIEALVEVEKLTFLFVRATIFIVIVHELVLSDLHLKIG